MSKLTENKGKVVGSGKIEQTVTYENDNGKSTGKYIVDQKTGKYRPVSVDYKTKK